MDHLVPVVSAEKTRAKAVSALLVVAVLVAALTPPLLDKGGPVSWVTAGTGCAIAFILLWRLGASFASIGRRLDHEIEQLENARETLKRQGAEAENSFARGRRDWEARLRALEQEKMELAKQLAAENEQSALSRRQFDDVQAMAARLNQENATLSAESAEALMRRQSLQKQYSELEESAGVVRTAHAEKSDQYRKVMAELQKLQNDFKQLQSERDSLRAEARRLGGRVETLAAEQSNAAMREAKWRSEASSWKDRADEAEQQRANRESDRALQEELAVRRGEISRLENEIEDLTRRQSLSAERSEIMKSEKEACASQLSQAMRQCESLEVVIGKLEDECRNAHLEPRHEMANHFVWNLNFFKEREIILNFLNEGATVDLVDASTEPKCSCEISGARRLARGAEGQIRVFGDKPLPREVLLKIRYTIYPQVASLKLRPFDSAKIERL